MHGLQKCLWVIIKRQSNSKRLLLFIQIFVITVTIIITSIEYMDSRLCFFVLALQIVSFVSATSRPFPSNDDDVGFNQQGQRAESLKALLSSNFNSWMDSKQSTKSKGVVAMEGLKEEAYYKKGLSKIGSSPPSCEHKCYGCTPCEAIQVPTTNKKHNYFLGVNYANYEPEGWKCKCGPSFYSP